MKEDIKNNIICTIGALTLPFIMWSICLICFEYWPLTIDSDWFYYPFFLIAVLSGLACVLFLRINIIILVLLSIFYLLCFGYLLFFYTFVFIGEVFGRWL